MRARVTLVYKAQGVSHVASAWSHTMTDDSPSRSVAAAWRVVMRVVRDRPARAQRRLHQGARPLAARRGALAISLAHVQLPFTLRLQYTAERATARVHEWMSLVGMAATFM